MKQSFEERVVNALMLAADPNVTITPSGMEKLIANLRKAAIDELWHKAPQELPTNEAVCVTFYNGGYHINVWNPYYKVWDDETGDDFEMEASKELRWMILEEESK